jgi:DNA-binding transcriptional LysR family regulator
MELKQLRSFVAVAHALSFSRAALELHISQPALSAQIQALEADLEVLLLHRNRRTVSLTTAGEAFLTDAELLLRNASEAATRAQRIAQGNAGHLRIGFVASAALELVPAIITAFRKTYPAVSFDLRNVRTVDQIRELQEGTLDAGFIRLPNQIPGLTLTPVHSEPFVLAMARTHPLARLKPSTLADFREQPFVAYARRWAPEFFDAWTSICTAAGFRPNIVQETAEMDTALALVAAGVGVAIVPQALARRRRRELKVKALPANSAQSQIAIAVRANADNPALNNLIALAKKEGKKAKSK